MTIPDVRAKHAIATIVLELPNGIYSINDGSRGRENRFQYYHRGCVSCKKKKAVWEKPLTRFWFEKYKNHARNRYMIFYGII